jgi:hypothetical protein
LASGRKPKFSASEPFKAFAVIVMLMVAFIVFLMALAIIVRLVLA